MCDHHGFHTPVSRYDRQAEVLCFVAVCDDCGAWLGELFSLAYLPKPKLVR